MTLRYFIISCFVTSSAFYANGDIDTSQQNRHIGSVGISPGVDANGYPAVSVDDQTTPISKDQNAESQQPPEKEKTVEEMNQDHISSQLNVLRGEQSTKESGNSQLERLRSEQRSR